MGRWLLVFACLTLIIPIVAHAETHEVQVGNFFFSPQELTIKAGDTVRWVWADGIHTSTSGDPEDPETTGDVWDGPVTSQNTTFEFTFPDTGVFPYFCAVHPSSMKATITVQAGTPVQKLTWTAIKRLFDDTSPDINF